MEKLICPKCNVQCSEKNSVLDLYIGSCSNCNFTYKFVKNNSSIGDLSVTIKENNVYCEYEFSTQTFMVFKINFNAMGSDIIDVIYEEFMDHKTFDPNFFYQHFTKIQKMVCFV